ncbi:hypothetical protein JCM10908_005067 [Rhodotorula pacifica]|uniref:uncharacterized protein n=1 Tax=Rhodotorula pacifica TaxID=1495444 RepID=UPI00317D59CE
MSAFIGLSEHYERVSASRIAQASFVALAVLILSNVVMPLFSRKERFKPAGKHCYIGGGSEGLGLSLACQLADRGAHVTILSRSQAKLDKAVAQIETHRQSPDQIFQAYACDLTDPSAAASTLHTACRAHASSSPDYIFACAGGCVPGFFTEMSAAKHWECMEWNFRTCLNTVHEGVKAMKEEGKGGRVVLTSSVLALMSFAGYSTYSPSKYAIRGLAEALRNELQLYSISVHLFLPATIYSPGFGNEQRLKPEVTKKIEGPDEGKSPDGVARELLKGVEREDFYITYEPVGHMLRNSRAITPRNNILLDTFWGFVGTLAFPVWRIMSPDGEVKKAAKANMKAGRSSWRFVEDSSPRNAQVLSSGRTSCWRSETGKFELSGIPPAPRGVPQIEVVFDIDANGILNVSAADKTTGKSNKERLFKFSRTDKGRLSKEEIERMVNEAEKYKAEDEAEAARITAKNGLESYAYSLRNLIDGDLKDKIEASDKETLDKAISETVSWLDASAEASKDEYEEKQKELEGVANPIMQKVYAAAGGAPGGMPGGAPGGAAPGAGADEPSVEEIY